MAEPVLVVDDLTVKFSLRRSEVTAVSDLSFTLNQGETLAVVGESGSGKSQAFLAIMGLLARNGRSSGTAMFDGVNLIGLPRGKLDLHRGRDLAMIFQDPMTSLNPTLRIGRQLSEVLVRHKGLSEDQAYRRSIEMVERVGIPDAARRVRAFPHELSGGMRQRVMIAMALLCQPKMLIADEPTTALDVTVQAQMLELFKELSHDFGTALVLITHDLGVVAGIADRMMVMYGGRAVEKGSIDELFYDPRHPYTLGLLNSTPHVEERLLRLHPISGAPPNMEHLPDGCAFHPRCPLRFDRCFAERPPLTTLPGGREKACFYGPALVQKEDAA